MKKVLTVLAVAMLGLISVTVGCDGGGPCASDADCAGTTNSVGDETPICDVDLGVCVPEDDEQCTEDLDCDLANPESATSVDECAANADCDDGDRCVEDSQGVTYCVTESGGQCAAIDLEPQDFTDVAGATFEGCTAGGTCTDGQCAF